MRRALVSAQGIAQETLQKAAAEADQIRAEAEADAAKRLNELNAEIALAESKLETAKQNNADFLSKMTAVYDAQMKVLIKLTSCEEMQPAEPSVSVAAPVPEASVEIPSAEPEQTPAPEEKSHTETLHEQATARFNFGELKFGSDYKPENDK